MSTEPHLVRSESDGQGAIDRSPILLYQRVLADYRIPIFERLNSLLGGRLVVCHGGSSADASFREVAVKRRSVLDQLEWTAAFRPFRLFGRPSAVIAEANPRLLSLLGVIAYCRSQGIPLVLWGHAGSRRRPSRSVHDIREYAHRWLHGVSDAFICYTVEQKLLLQRYCDERKLFVATNTVDSETLRTLRVSLGRETREVVKKRLGLESRHYLAFIGRLIREKRVAEAIDLVAELQRRGRDVGLIVIGDGPEGERLRLRVRRRAVRDVHFLGASFDPHVWGPYLYASDVLVMPGYVGLAVNHALWLGVPVLTRPSAPEGPFHSPEIAYVVEGETGVMEPARAPSDWVPAVEALFRRRVRFYESCTRYAERHLRVEFMLKGFEQALSYVGVL